MDRELYLRFDVCDYLIFHRTKYKNVVNEASVRCCYYISAIKVLFFKDFRTIFYTLFLSPNERFNSHAESTTERSEYTLETIDARYLSLRILHFRVSRHD